MHQSAIGTSGRHRSRSRSANAPDTARRQNRPVPNAEPLPGYEVTGGREIVRVNPRTEAMQVPNDIVFSLTELYFLGFSWGIKEGVHRNTHKA